MAIAAAQYTMLDLNDIVSQPTPPDNPAVGLVWCNEGAYPNELLRWTGMGLTNARRYQRAISGNMVNFPDLYDDTALQVAAKTVAVQSGSGTPSPENVRTIQGKNSVVIKRTGKNIADPLIVGSTKNGVTLTYDAATQEITLNGTVVTTTASWAFATQYLPIDGNNVVSVRHVSGTATFGATHILQLAEDGWTNGSNISFPINGGVAYETRTAARNYTNFIIRLDVGNVLNNYRFKFQVERGLTVTDWEAYKASEWTLTPSGAGLWGLPGAEDEIDNLGNEVHRTWLFYLYGVEAWWYAGANQPTLTTLARFQLDIADFALSSVGVCSHFPMVAGPNAGYTTETACGHGATGGISIYILKSRLSGWSDAWTDAQKIAAFKTWLAAQKTAGKTLQVLYQLTAARTFVGGTQSVTLTGTSGFSSPTDLGSFLRFRLPLTVQAANADTAAFSTHFPKYYAYSTNVWHFYVTGTSDNAAYFYVYKGALTTADLAGFNAWVDAQATAGRPVSIRYQKAGEQALSTIIRGTQGENTMMAKAVGTSLTVTYVGSGWAKVGESNNVSSDLAKILQSITQDERGMVITGMGGTFVLVLGPSEIGFYQAGEKVAYFTGNQIYITSAEFTGEIKIGNYIISKTSDGGLVFK